MADLDKISKKQEPLEEKVLNDELSPNRGEPVPQEKGDEGNEPDTAGTHGDMAVETAEHIDPSKARKS